MYDLEDILEYLNPYGRLIRRALIKEAARRRINLLSKIAALRGLSSSVEKLISNLERSSSLLKRTASPKHARAYRVARNLLEQEFGPLVGHIPLKEEGAVLRFLRETRKTPKPVPDYIKKILRSYIIH